MSEDNLLLEGQVLESGRDRAKQEVIIDLIREGFGNPRDNHFYGAPLLEASAEMFSGAKMYVDHLDPDTAKKLGGLPRPVAHQGGRVKETAYLAPGETKEGFGTNDGDVAVVR